MSGFTCAKCTQEGRDAVVRYPSDRYVIEIAAKRNDGFDRARQVSTFRFCKRHAIAYIEAVGQAFGREALTVEQLAGQEVLL